MIAQLSGSRGGVIESFAAIRPSLSHVIKLLTNQPSGHDHIERPLRSCDRPALRDPACKLPPTKSS